MSNNKDFKVKNGIKPTVYHEAVGTVVSGSVGYRLDVASYDNVSFSVAAQELDPYSVFFKPDGTKMYVVGSKGADVNEYDLSTAWDVSTASYSQNFSLATQDTGPVSVFFKPDGTKMYVLGITGDNLYEYDLSIAWDISTASYLQAFSVATQDTNPFGLFFKPDGTKVYVVGGDGDDVNEYSLSAAWDVSTASYVQNFSVATQTTSPRGLCFKPDGTKMYVIDAVSDAIAEYSLSTAWDVSTASYVQSLSVSSQETNPWNIFFKPDGTKMYLLGNGSDAVHQYSTALYTATLDLSTGSVFELTPTSDITVSLSNPADSGTVSGATLLLDGADPSGAASTVSVDLWSGNGTSQTISNGVDLSTDGGLVMAFRRDSGGAFIFSDTEQGTSSQLSMTYNSTSAATTDTNKVTSFNTNGFSIGDHSDINATGGSYVGYTIKKTPGEFDIIKYTGNGPNGQTLSHNLGHKPQFIIVKRLDGVSEYVAWFYHYDSVYVNVQNFSKGSRLTSTFGTAFGTFFTSVTDTSITVDDNGTDSPNESLGEYIMYLFGATGNIVKTGVYAGDGTSNRDINVGFEPEFVMIKAMANVYDPEWIIVDKKRGGTHPKVIAYSVGGEDSYNGEATTIEFTSTGYTCTGTATALNFVNRSGRDYQYIAFAAPQQATITYDTNIQWAGGTAPTSPAAGETDVLTFSTRDGGTTYNAALAISGAS